MSKPELVVAPLTPFTGGPGGISQDHSAGEKLELAC